MTSEKAMLIVVALVGAGGCSVVSPQPEPLVSPYDSTRLMAVAPLINESGTTHADGLLLADLLAQQLEQATRVDVLPVNRTLAAMEAAGLARLAGPGDAVQLLRLLGADYLVVGTITAYDPYDPPRLGVALELYGNPRARAGAGGPDPRGLARAAAGPQTQAFVRSGGEPLTRLSAFFDAASPDVRAALGRYADRRGVDMNDRGWRRHWPLRSAAERQSERLYRIRMDLYSEFVSYEMCWRLLAAEWRRVAPEAIAQARP